MRWDTLWLAAKDIGLTGTGVFLILSQVLSVKPSDVILVTGLALTTPSVGAHAKALLGGHPHPPTGGPSSPSSPPPSSSPPSPLPGATGDGPARP